MINNETMKKILPPILELAFDADIDVQFDDFEDLRENPMLQPLMTTFPDLFEKFSKRNLKNIQDFKKDFNEQDPVFKIEENTPEHIKKEIKSTLLMWKFV